MEIQKIFSDEMNEERLYSVLMSEEELSLFSEVKNINKHDIALKDIKSPRGFGRASFLGE